MWGGEEVLFDFPSLFVILHILFPFCFAFLWSLLNMGLFFSGTGCFPAQHAPAKPTGEDLHCSPGS